jgi:phosphoribosyl 1,2-cyclic phosphate phosphodiesterase
VIYLIRKEDRCIFYANDTGYFPAETWQYLEDHRPRIDFVSLDCTFGVQSNRSNHMGLTACVEVKERLIKLGCAGETTIFCANHFSHNGQATYDELVPIAEQHGFQVSYDGMEIRI